MNRAVVETSLDEAFYGTAGSRTEVRQQQRQLWLRRLCIDPTLCSQYSIAKKNLRPMDYDVSIMAFKLTKALVQEMLDEDSTLQTIANQYTLDQIWDLIEDRDAIGSEDALFEALMDVMYATRPEGWL